MTTLPTIGGYCSATSFGVTSTATSLSVTQNLVTGGVQTDDWILLTISSGSGLSTSRKPTAMPGWTTILAFAQVGTATMCFGVYARKRLAGDGSSYGITQSGTEANAMYARTFFIRGADDVANWVKGVFNPRAVNATSLTSVGASITTTTANTLAMLIACERTTAAETDAQVTVANFTKYVNMLASTGIDQVTTIATKTMTAPGATGDATVTYPNTQAVNAIAGLLGIPPVPDPVDLGLAIKVSDGTVLKDTRLKVSNGTALYTPRGVKKIRFGYATVTQMLAQTTFYCAHRGGSLDFPEMSAYAYGQAAIYDYPALELSLARTSDGVWFGLHDDSLDRTSLGTATSTLVPSAMTWAQVQTYQILGSVATNNPTQPNRPYMRWEEIMAVYYASHVIFVDPKVATGNRDELLNMMDAMPGDPRARFVGKYYGVSGNVGNTSGWAFDLAQRGYKSWGYFYESDLSNYATYAPRWDILGQDYSASQSAWDALKAAAPGRPVIGHICPNTTAASTALTKGAKGLMVSGVVNVKPPVIV